MQYKIDRIRSIKDVKVRKADKKGQEEMVGFILIIVLIIVIGLFFLFFVKPKAAAKPEFQIDNLLNALLAYTSDYKDKEVRAVIKDCYEGQSEACGWLSGNVPGLLDKVMEKGGLVVGSQIRGYAFSVANAAPILELESGNLTGNMLASVIIIPAAPDILVKLAIYY